MAVTIRAMDDGDGDWGAAPADVAAVAISVARCFPVFGHEDELAITLRPMTSGPMTVQDASLPVGEAVVWLSTHGTVWAQLAYQFAHEFCHVIADPRTLPWDRFLWLEEALCETASLYALRCMARSWAVEPPYWNWRDYSVALEGYAAERMSESARRLPAGTSFHAWLSGRLPLLEQDADRREDNAVVASQLLPIVEAEPTVWQAVRHLHAWPRAPAVTLSQFFDGWAAACPSDSRHGAEALARVLNSSPSSR